MPEKTPKVKLLEALKLFQTELEGRYLKRAPEYTLVKLETPTGGFGDSYVMTKDEEAIGDIVNIPSPSFIKAVSLKEVLTQNVPVEGYQIGDQYIEFETRGSNGQTSTIYLNANEFINAISKRVPQYNLIDVDIPDTPEYIKHYRLLKDNNAIGSTISIPNFVSIQSASVKEILNDNEIFLGSITGDQYIDFTLKDAGDSIFHIYINFKEFLPSIVRLAPKYTLIERNVPEEGFLKSFNLLKDNVIVGSTINIPNIPSLNSIEVKTVDVNNKPLTGYKVGEQYLEFKLQDKSNNSSFIYVAIKELLPSFNNLSPDYLINELATPEEGFFKSYQLLKNDVAVGSIINIPKSSTINSVSVKTVEQDDIPIEGFKTGDKYFDFEEKDESGNILHTYLDMKEFPFNVKASVKEDQGNGNVITSLEYTDGELTPFKGITALQATDLNVFITGGGNVFSSVNYNPANRRFTFNKGVIALEEEDFEEITYEEIEELWTGGSS